MNKITLADDTSNSDNTYNAIVNPAVRKRDRKRAMPLPAPTTPLVKAEAKSQTKQEMKLEKNEEPKVGKVAPVKEAKPSVVAAAKKGAAAPNLKRQGSSGISQMFAKAAAKPKKPASMTGSATPTDTNTPSPALSDDGEDDSDMPDVKPTPIARKARKSRQDDLRQMMEESDEEIESKPETPPEEPVEEEEELPAEPEPKADEGPAEEVVSSGDGRKRGRRRVAKKVTKMDDQGYLSKFTPRVSLVPIPNSELQSLFRNKLGSHFPRTNPHRPPSRRSKKQKNRRLLPRPRKELPRPRVTLCRSFLRNKHSRVSHGAI